MTRTTSRARSRVKDFGVNVALTAMVAGAGVSLHFLVRLAQGQPIKPGSIVNFIIELTLLAAPCVFYARHVIGALKRSRAEMKNLSRRLAIAVDQAGERQPRQIRLPGKYESRNSHAAQRHSGLFRNHEGSASGPGAQSALPGLCQRHSQFGTPPAGHHQRHSRPVQDRVRQDVARQRRGIRSSAGGAGCARHG